MPTRFIKFSFAGTGLFVDFEKTFKSDVQKFRRQLNFRATQLAELLREHYSNRKFGLRNLEKYDRIIGREHTTPPLTSDLLSESFAVTKGEYGGSGVYIKDVLNAKKFRWQEEGTKPHSITAPAKKNLWFWWVKKSTEVRTPSVWNPGYEGYAYSKGAIERIVQRVRVDAHNIFGKGNYRTSMRSL
jgi:hypothetical protein